MKKPLTNKNGDVRELTAQDFRKSLRFVDLPALLKRKLVVIKKRYQSR